MPESALGRSEAIPRAILPPAFSPLRSGWQPPPNASRFPTMTVSYDPSKIEALEGLEAVRHRPGLYLGDLMSPSLPARLMAQAMCHAVDEAVGGRKIRVSLEGTTSTRACVSYNAGMPLDIDRATRSYVALVFLVLHAGCSNRKKHIDVGSSFCELGLAVMNACCSQVSLEVSHKERSASFEFARGVLVSHKEPVPAPDQNSPACPSNSTLRFCWETRPSIKRSFTTR
jgi:DNA gyrase/topoisomerase IV subunit B